jgi:hypothetical protein
MHGFRPTATPYLNYELELRSWVYLKDLLDRHLR